MENTTSKSAPWNKGKLVGQKLPLKLKEVWAIRVRLQLAGNTRDLALFNLAIDSKLQGSDLVRVKVSDIYNSGVVASRAMILQKKTSQPVQFEITEGTRESEWMTASGVSGADHLFPSRIAELSPPVDAPICKDRRALGIRHRSLPYPLAGKDEAYTYLQENPESPSCAAFARAHEAAEHCALFGRRSRRCALEIADQTEI